MFYVCAESFSAEQGKTEMMAVKFHAYRFIGFPGFMANFTRGMSYAINTVTDPGYFQVEGDTPLRVQRPNFLGTLYLEMKKTSRCLGACAGS